jgi:prepilin-type N-terminal cleavage/methylation domain-containing protein
MAPPEGVMTRQAPRTGQRPHPGTRPVQGFSLIEILVVITLIGLLMTFGFGAMQNAMEAGRVTKCKNNLDQIGQALISYRDIRRNGRWHNESGIRFLLLMHKNKQITGRDAEVFLCPGTSDINDTGSDGSIGSSYEDWDALTSDTISYAGRDMVGHRIRGVGDGSDVLAADDNEFGPNHKVATNILYANGSVISFDLFENGGDLVADNPSLEIDGLPVGPESPHPPLQVLRID